MKKRTHVLFGISIVAVIAVMFFMQWKTTEKYRNFEALGEKELTPIRTKQKIETYTTRGRRNTRTINYVQFRVNIGEKRYLFLLSTNQAYGENSLDAGINAVKQKKMIKKNVFWNGKQIYCSKKATTVEGFIKEKVTIERGFYEVAIGVILYLWIVSWLFQRRKFKSILNKEMEQPVVIVTHASIGYVFLMGICIATMIIFGGVTYSFYMKNGLGPFAIVFAMFVLGFLSLAVIIFLLMKNRVIFAFEDKFIFRTMYGNIYTYRWDEVQNYVVRNSYRNYYIYLYTSNKKIQVLSYAQNYYDFIDLCGKKLG